MTLNHSAENIPTFTEAKKKEDNPQVVPGKGQKEQLNYRDHLYCEFYLFISNFCFFTFISSYLLQSEL